MWSQVTLSCSRLSSAVRCSLNDIYSYLLLICGAIEEVSLFTLGDRGNVRSLILKPV